MIHQLIFYFFMTVVRKSMKTGCAQLQRIHYHCKLQLFGVAPPFGTHPYHRSVAIPMHIWHKLYPLLGFLADVKIFVFVGFAVLSGSLFSTGRLLGDPPKTEMF